MSDAWRQGLSQNIEEDEEIDDDHLVPPTPGQEDIDTASPSQDNASALSCLTSASTSSKRPLMFLGEPLSTLDFDHTPDDELMPYLAADVSETSSKVGLIEDCPGDELETGFEKALSNAAAAAVGVNTTQWGTPPTSPLRSPVTVSSAITSIAASQTTTAEGTSLTATKLVYAVHRVLPCPFPSPSKIAVPPCGDLIMTYNGRDV
ncbi:unnamed protein product [Meganyctiphanes norvegica]|uniref:Uncharacterized protein n=1 Tax=Meganyctiphanes norvegica TaxID=48144 RepID=A0AAV2QW97_MEGNR